MGYLKCFNVTLIFKRYSQNLANKMKYLNVAEKNDAAKNIAGFLSRGNSNRREGLSPYNKIYEFQAQVQGQNATMVMTSVSGHLLHYEFAANFRSWTSCNPVALFDAPIHKACSTDGDKIKRTLEREIRSCNALIIWTDCDREGENIGFEIIKVCTAIKPNIRVYRAKFSEITAASVWRALNNLGEPDQNVNNAVDVRQEMDLRTGAAFTRLQTLHLAKVFPQKLSDKLISYGSCQFPTLGFVVERYKDIENFIPEPFWRIKMEHTKDDLTVDFHWDRERLFEKQPCQTILEICQENPTTTVTSVVSKPKNKWRPLPLDTVEMEKTISRKLKINAKNTMKIAERLYTQGYISYPRTETNIFPKELNLTPLVEQQVPNNAWGQFAQRVLNEGGPNPRQGKKSDQAHPPIHPTKYADNLNGDEKRVYEYIVRHFLACVSKDAVGHETIVKVCLANENFTAKGLCVLEKNYLDVYIYEKWNSKEIHRYREGETFQPTLLQIDESETTAPKYLTEADLIALMEKHGIGTDATHADHIDTIKSREYVGLSENMYFIPGTLGMGLVEGYDNIGLEVSLAKPILRSEFENDLKLICDGRKDPNLVLTEQKEKYRAVFQNVINQIHEIEERLAHRIDEQRTNINMEFAAESYENVLKCVKCGQDMVLKKRKTGIGYYVTCNGFPDCKNVIWLPTSIEQCEVIDTCQYCGETTKKIKVKFKTGQNPFLGEPNTKEICIGGCDENILMALGISLTTIRRSGGDDVVINNQPNNPPPPPPGGGVATTNRTQRTTRNTNNDRGNNTWIRPDPGLATQRGGDGRNPGWSNGPDKGSPGPGGGGSGPGTRPQGSPNEEVVCNCGTEAVLLTVRKEGPNTGRKFYKCLNGTCNFFLWAPSTDNNTSLNQTNHAPQTPMCRCNMPAVKRTVQKDGPNKGRSFYTCQGDVNQRCNFFQWTDDTTDAGAANGGGANVGGGAWDNSWSAGTSGWGNQSASGWSNKNHSNNKKRKKGGGQSFKKKSTGGGKRKCGICGEEGHTRTNCPNK